MRHHRKGKGDPLTTVPSSQWQKERMRGRIHPQEQTRRQRGITMFSEDVQVILAGAFVLLAVFLVGLLAYG